MDERQGRDFMNTSRLRITSVCFLLWPLIACESSGPEDQIPFALVNIEIDLRNQQYLDLQFSNGHVNIEGGVRGITIYRASTDEYRAFERNCSFQPLDSCAQVEMDDSGLFFIDPCCSSTFDFNGFPTGGPASLPLRQYTTVLDGNFLIIAN